jgi:hypothetical protein
MSENEYQNIQWEFPDADTSAYLGDPRVPGHIKLAIFFELIKPEYTVQDYLVEAIMGPPDKPGKTGYETGLIWAVQGSGKSSRGLQYLKWLYKDWEDVLASTVFTPQEFINKLEAVQDDETMPAIFWDDIGVHFPASKFKTDIQQYEAIDSTFAAIRTKVNVILASLPVIDRCAKSIKDNATFEFFLGRNQRELTYRLFRLPGTRQIESNFFKIQVQKFSQFDLFDVPIDIWNRYWTRRINLTREALTNLKETTDMGENENFMPVLEASLLVEISPNTIQQMGSRGVIETKKIKGKLCVSRADILKVKQLDAVRGRKPLRRVNGPA